MKVVFSVWACFICCVLCAEKIGNVEYHLPSQAQDWKVINKTDIEKKKSKTIIYAPNTTAQEFPEYFGAHVNNLPVNIRDKLAIEKSLQSLFPEQETKINVLETGPESVLYEWIVSEKGKEKVHGWSRVFATTEATVMLTYQTEQIDQVKNVRPQWVQALKEAKIKP